MNAREPFVLGEWTVDPATGLLTSAAAQRRLTPKLMDLLVALAQRAGHVVTRDELLREVWGARGAVSDEPLTRAVAELRKTLGDDRAGPGYIETIPKRGYRVVAKVGVVEPREPAKPEPAAPTDVGLVPAPSRGIAQPALAPTPSAFDGPRRFKPGWWRVGVIGAAAVTAIAAVLTFALRPAPVKGPAPAVGVAVLPFADLSPTADRQYFADGVQEEIIARLTGIPTLRVAPRATVSSYRDAGKPVGEIASELGVVAVMQGTVRYAEDRVRVTAQLIDAATNTNVWAEIFDRPLTLENLFDIQAEIAEAVATGLTRRLAVADAAGSSGDLPTASLPAYEAFLLGKYHYRRSQPGDLKVAAEQFQYAVNADGGFADAWDWLAYAWLAAGADLQWTTPSEAFPHARAAALRALELDADLWTARALLAFLRATYDWEWQAGLVELERAVQAAPQESGTVWSYAYVLALLGRHDEAIELVRGLADAFPDDARNRQEVAERLIDAGRFGEAAEAALTARALNAEPGQVSELVGVAAFGSGDLPAAIAELERAVALQNGAAAVVGRLAATYARAGRESDARALLAELEARATGPIVNVATLARVYVGLGEWERALALLEKGVDERQREVLTIVNDPYFAVLRGEPRFAQIVERMGLASPAAER
jgi:TolB-like protein/DNA-binding winged helix-turn-helix (wHTH) protein/Flp pilus assembly protein TadD